MRFLYYFHKYALRWSMVVLGFIFFFGCKNPQNQINSKTVWIFILAGQSNMAGRGLVEEEDASTHPDILVLDSMDNWTLAQEPLHYYEPVRRGLDCGMAFAREMIRLNLDTIRIGLVPCAVGGSSVEQWLYDSIHRGVKLYSNFNQKISRAKLKGSIKGILWHQGESNLNTGSLSDYSQRLDSLFMQMRSSTGSPTLPIIMGELGEFLAINEYKGGQVTFNSFLRYKDSLSTDLKLVTSKGLEHNGDSVHFNSASLRELGRRYARAFMDD